MNPAHESLQLIPQRIHDLLSGEAIISTCCTPEATVAVRDPAQIETAARLVTSGGQATTARPPGVVVLAAAAGSRVLVEGVRRAQERPVATFVASVTADVDGRVERYVEFDCHGARRPPRAPADSDLQSADLATVVDRYFRALDEGHFDAAADCFSTNVLYSHPPYLHTGIDDGGRIEFNGRDELRAAFDRRGRTTFDHIIDVVAQQGANGLIEGRVEGLPNGRFGSFISSCVLDIDGRIERYVSFYCEPGITR